MDTRPNHRLALTPTARQRVDLFPSSTSPLLKGFNVNPETIIVKMSFPENCLPIELVIGGHTSPRADFKPSVTDLLSSLDSVSRADHPTLTGSNRELARNEFAAKLKAWHDKSVKTGNSSADGTPGRERSISDLFAILSGQDFVSTQPNPDYSESISDLISRIDAHPRLRDAPRLAARLKQLQATSREEQPGQAPPALSSIKALIGFLVAHPELAQPSLVLTTEGHLRGRWRRSPQEYLALEFPDAEEVRFVVFTADPKHPYKTIRASGSATPASVMSLLEPYGVWRWTMARSTGAQAE